MHIRSLAAAFLFSTTAMAQSPDLFVYKSSVNRQDREVYPVYAGDDLGTRWTAGQTMIKIWAPTMRGMKLYLYDAGVAGNQLGEYSMEKNAQGVWWLRLKGNQAGRFFTVRVQDGMGWSEEVTDPYSRAVGINGKRTAIIDPATTNPPGWAADKSPGRFTKPCDAVIYELHVRDATVDVNSGVPEAYRGRFAGLSLPGTKDPWGGSTGLSHICKLGVTHVQLLPFYDYSTVDESKPGKPQYNWGYDPLHYNVPEGSYSTRPDVPAIRIRELKQLIQAFHRQGLRVIMDVVYNHTALGKTGNFNILVPGYYYRTLPDGSFSDASACGNETASDAPMFRKFMMESLEYWVREFHIDGFRFDLMGIHDKETMNLISRRLHQLKPDILLHGEGWTAGGSPLAEEQRAVKGLAYTLEGIGVFSDEIRDAMKGGWNNEKDNGFVSGKGGMEESIKYGIAGAVQHPDIDYSKVNYSKAPFAKQPWQCIVYNECHDNHTLWDRLLNSNPADTEGDRKKMYKLAQLIVLTSQGIPFLHAGQEMYRTKQGIDNSYNKPDSVNRIDWARMHGNKEMVVFTQKLIALRRAHPAFRLNDAGAVASRLHFLPSDKRGWIAYTIDEKEKGQYLVVLNAAKEQTRLVLPAGKWRVLFNTAGGDDKTIYTGGYDVGPIDGVVLLRAGR